MKITSCGHDLKPDVDVGVSFRNNKNKGRIRINRKTFSLPKELSCGRNQFRNIINIYSIIYFMYYSFHSISQLLLLCLFIPSNRKIKSWNTMQIFLVDGFCCFGKLRKILNKYDADPTCTTQVHDISLAVSSNLYAQMSYDVYAST